MKIGILLAASLVSLQLSAGAVEIIFPLLNLPVPDGDSSGLVNQQTVNLTSSDPITSVGVWLNLRGIENSGFNGDLYAWLQHDSGFSVLLNRPGRDINTPAGYGDNGIAGWFRDTSPDVHTYRTTLSGPFPITDNSLLGNFGPDGRETDPANVVTADPRTALLQSFVGLNPNGTWTLFVSDVASGGEVELNSWGLALTVDGPDPSIVPDGGVPLILFSLVLVALAGVRRAMNLP
jgi:subtilisin-like proprotein convertase family protein